MKNKDDEYLMKYNFMEYFVLKKIGISEYFISSCQFFIP